VNSQEAKKILLIYRPGMRDGDDPEVAAALKVVKDDAELARWFEEHCARQEALRQKFRQIAIPAGLKEQIISESAAAAKATSRREKIVGAMAVAVIAMSLAVIALVYLPHNPKLPPPVANTLANYLSQMAGNALNPYYMNTATNTTQIQSYLTRFQAPADYVLPAGLQNVAITGCAVEDWQKSKACMICFRTGKSLPPGQQGDLWLFVIERAAIPDAASVTSPQYTQVRGLMTATWTRDGKLYVLGIKGDQQAIQKFL
jgi:hypothetical protein